MHPHHFQATLDDNSIQLLSSGRIKKLVLNGITVVESVEPVESTGSGSFLMYPWVNRLEQPNPLYPPEQYDGNGLAIHGVVVNPENNIQIEKEEQARVLTCTLKQPIDNLPTFYSKYVLEKGKLTVELKVTGESTQPLCFGYHPYLQINDASLQKLQIDSNIRQNWQLDEKMLPVYPPVMKEKVIVNTGSYDDLFVVEEGNGYLQLKGEGHVVRIENKSNMKYWQVYTPADRKRIAVEPMTFVGNLYALYPKMKPELPQEGSFTISAEQND